MLHKSDIAIVGGGVIGSAIAWFASQLTASVTLIDRGQVGTFGATSVSKGLLRVYDPDPVLADLGRAAIKFYLDWPVIQLGASPTHHCGLIYRLKPQHVVYAQTFVAKHCTDQYPIALSRFAEMKEHYPQLQWRPDDWVIHEPLGGYGDPVATARGFAQGAVKNGVKLLERMPVTGVREEKDGYWIVASPVGEVRARVVIVAGGALSVEVLRGLSLQTRTIAIPKFRSKQEVVGHAAIDEIAGTYLRPTSVHSVVAGSQIHSFSDWRSVTDTASELQQADAHLRLRSSMSGTFLDSNQNGSQGFDGYTPDLRPLLGSIHHGSGLIAATGFSGRGYKMAPAIGSRVAHELVESYGFSGEPHSLGIDGSLDALAPMRFAGGSPCL